MEDQSRRAPGAGTPWTGVLSFCSNNPFLPAPRADGLPFCSCIEAAIRRRYPDELASLTEEAVCGALYSWVIAEFDDSPEGKAFVAGMEEMRARRDD